MQKRKNSTTTDMQIKIAEKLSPIAMPLKKKTTSKISVLGKCSFKFRTHSLRTKKTSQKICYQSTRH